MALRLIEVPYIPADHAAALAWLDRFFKATALNPGAFGVDPRDVASLGEMLREFRETYLLTAAHDQQSSLAAAERIILARNAVVQSVQRMVRTINANPLTSDEDRTLLGLSNTPV